MGTVETKKFVETLRFMLSAFGRHTRAGFTRVGMTGSTRLRKMAGAAILGGAGAVTLFLPPAACEARPHDPFSWHEPLSSLFIPFSLRPFELAQYELVGTKLDGAGIQVTEAKDGYECSVALPGVRPADLDVSVEGSVLLLKGKTRHSSFE